jgi:hypothetical protein
MERMTEPAKSWLADNFISVTSSDIKEINVSGPDRVEIKLSHAKDSDAFILAGLRPEDGTLESSKINQLTGALNRLGIDDVVDPAIALKETGLDNPVIFKATTKEGLVYTLKVGNTLANDSFDRYFTISVTNEPAIDWQINDNQKQESISNKEEQDSDKKKASELAAGLNSTFSPWIYVIKSYRSEPILFTRDDLIKKPEPPKAEEKPAKASKAQEDSGQPEPAGKTDENKKE